MNSQYIDVKKTFLKTGPYVLSDEYKSFMLSVDAWSKKTNAEKDEYFNKFLDQRIMRLNTVQPRKNAEKYWTKAAKTTATNNEQTYKIKNVVYFKHFLN